tara:strand:- start:6993 stop:9293 length:2301 start_codon:yes stop_codon:yes gene_type:complete
MGEFSQIEVKILDRLTEVIDGKLESIGYDNSEKDRMLYSTCLNDDEKYKFTKKEIKKLQKKIAKCNSNIAGYISAFLNKYELEHHDGDFYSYRERICRNFISNYYEGIEQLAEEYTLLEKVEQEDEMYFEAVLNDELYSFDKNEIEDFIKYMVYAQRLSTFRSILESVEEEKKKPKADAIIDKMKADHKERESQKTKDELSATLDNLRGQQISSVQLFKIIKNITKLEKDALEYLKDDIGWYLWSMKTAQECFYSKEQTERAYKKIEEKYTKEKQLELGYLKKTKFFFEEEYEDPEEPIYIDKEKLLFPNEFTSIKELITIIDKELNKLESISVENKTNNIKPDMYSQYNNDINEEVLLVEELEKRLAIEAVEYKKNCDDLWETYTFDPKYFDTYISGDLYNMFLKSIYEKVKPLNDFEINKYLTLSVNQFKTHTPEKRAEAFKRIYHDTYWHPNQMEYKANEYDNKYAMHVWKHYTNHFHLFKEATENVLQDFKKGLIGTGKKTSNEPNQKRFDNKQFDTLNSSWDYPLNNDYKWCKMILDSFKTQFDKDNPIDYFKTQFNLRSDVFSENRFYNLCRENTVNLKKAFIEIRDNDNKLPLVSTSLMEQVYSCQYVFKKEVKNLFEEKKKVEVEIKTENFDSIIIALNTLIKNTSINTGKENVIQKNLKDLVSDEKYAYIIKLLEDLSITVNGKSIVTPRKKGALRGVVEALRDKMIVPNIGIASLCNVMAKQIDLELKSELDASTTSENYKKQTLEYIKNNPLQHS